MDNTPDLPFLNIHKPFSDEKIFLAYTWDKHNRMFLIQKIAL